MERVEGLQKMSSLDQLDEAWRVALKNAGIQLSGTGNCIFVPAWRSGQTHKSEQKTRLVVDRENLLTVVERSRKGIDAYDIPFVQTILVQEGETPCLDWIGLWWKCGESLRSVRIEFNSGALPIFRPSLDRILQAWEIKRPSTEADSDPLSGHEQPDHDLYRQILRFHLGTGEQIDCLIYQPRIISCKRFLRKRESVTASQQMAVRTPFRWILISDLRSGTGISSLPIHDWKLTAQDADTLSWTPIFAAAGPNIRMSFQGRAYLFMKEVEKLQYGRC
jgi:hypothetical protein